MCGWVVCVCDGQVTSWGCFPASQNWTSGPPTQTICLLRYIDRFIIQSRDKAIVFLLMEVGSFHMRVHRFAQCYCFVRGTIKHLKWPKRWDERWNVWCEPTFKTLLVEVLWSLPGVLNHTKTFSTKPTGWVTPYFDPGNFVIINLLYLPTISLLSSRSCFFVGKF